MILSLGKQPKAIDCFTHENVADIIAWLAIIAASVAITNTGQNRLPESHKKEMSDTKMIAAEYVPHNYDLEDIILIILCTSTPVVVSAFITWNRFIEYSRMRIGVLHQISSLAHIGKEETGENHNRKGNLYEQRNEI